MTDLVDLGDGFFPVALTHTGDSWLETLGRTQLPPSLRVVDLIVWSKVDRNIIYRVAKRGCDFYDIISLFRWHAISLTCRDRPAEYMCRRIGHYMDPDYFIRRAVCCSVDAAYCGASMYLAMRPQIVIKCFREQRVRNGQKWGGSSPSEQKIHVFVIFSIQKVICSPHHPTSKPMITQALHLSPRLRAPHSNSCQEHVYEWGYVRGKRGRREKHGCTGEASNHEMKRLRWPGVMIKR